MKKNILATAIISAFLSLSVIAAPLVTVNGQGIEKSQVDAEIKNLVARSNGQMKDTPEVREAIKNQLISQVLIQQEAKKRGLSNTKEYKAAISTIETELLANSLFMDIDKKNPVSDSEARKLYDQKANAIKGTQEIQLRQIIVKSSADEKKVQAELAKGGKFEQIAQARSIDPSAKQTGGLVPNYTNLKEFEMQAPAIYKVISTLKKGGYSKEAVDINGHLVIFKVEDRRNAVTPPFDAVKESLKNEIKQQKIAQIVNELRQKASIK